jgi:tight adherence protein C
MDLVSTLTDPKFLIAVFAAVSAAAVVFTLGSSFIGGRSQIKQRIKRVALEREKMRAEEMARLRGGSKEEGPRSIRRVAGREYMTKVVQRFDLQKAFVDENTVEKLAQAGYRGQGPLTTFIFLRFVTPFALFFIGLFYLHFTVFSHNPLWQNAIYALFIGLIGAYVPNVLLKNRTIKRQQSIRRAWPDALDLMLLCVEAGMSIEHAFKRVSKEIGMQSVELAEELTMTTAELNFLEDRTRAYENLGRRTGIDNVKSVMTSLIQADRHGTSVGTSLRVMAEEGRDARMMEAEKKAASLPPKLTVPLIIFFLPVLFIVIMAPSVIKIMAGGTLN